VHDEFLSEILNGKMSFGRLGDEMITLKCILKTYDARL
jgi:hypothetical protein